MTRERRVSVSHFTLGGERYLVLSAERRRSSRLAALTPAERIIVAALLDGASNAKIARALGRSPRTIANHVASILRKLGVGSRSELAARLG